MILLPLRNCRERTPGVITNCNAHAPGVASGARLTRAEAGARGRERDQPRAVRVRPNANEEGTEAAAVTVVGVSVTSLPQTATMRVDRLYLFAIRERLSGTILFIGKVVAV